MYKTIVKETRKVTKTDLFLQIFEFSTKPTFPLPDNPCSNELFLAYYVTRNFAG